MLEYPTHLMSVVDMSLFITIWAYGTATCHQKGEIISPLHLTIFQSFASNFFLCYVLRKPLIFALMSGISFIINK